MLPAHLEIGHARRRSISEWAKLCQTRRAESSVVAELKAVEIIVGVEFNAPLDTTEVISEAVFTANHLTDTDKQNSTGKYR